MTRLLGLLNENGQMKLWGVQNLCYRPGRLLQEKQHNVYAGLACTTASILYCVEQSASFEPAHSASHDGLNHHEIT